MSRCADDTYVLYNIVVDFRCTSDHISTQRAVEIQNLYTLPASLEEWQSILKFRHIEHRANLNLEPAIAVEFSSLIF